MKKTSLLVAALMSVNVVHAESGRTGATTLIRTFSAISGALGGAGSALPGSLDATFFNPASGATILYPEIQATYLRGLEKDSLGNLRYGHAFGFGSVFVGGDYYDAGTIDVNLSDGTKGARHAQQDTIGIVGFGLGRYTPFSLGATMKIFRLELAEEASASGAAFDLGAQWRTPVTGLTVGVSGTNMGSDVEFEQEADPLPTAGRAGVAYDLELSRFRKFRDVPYAVTVLADAVGQRYDGTSLRAGLELRRYITDETTRAGSVSLRGGYQQEPRTLTAGLGLRLAGFGFDYAFGVIDDLNNTHRATLSWRFLNAADRFALGGEIRPAKRRLTKEK